MKKAATILKPTDCKAQLLLWRDSVLPGWDIPMQSLLTAGVPPPFWGQLCHAQLLCHMSQLAGRTQGLPPSSQVTHRGQGRRRSSPRCRGTSSTDPSQGSSGEPCSRCQGSLQARYWACSLTTHTAPCAAPRLPGLWLQGQWSWLPIAEQGASASQLNPPEPAPDQS